MGKISNIQVQDTTVSLVAVRHPSLVLILFFDYFRLRSKYTWNFIRDARWQFSVCVLHTRRMVVVVHILETLYRDEPPRAAKSLVVASSGAAGAVTKGGSASLVSSGLRRTSRFPALRA